MSTIRILLGIVCLVTFGRSAEPSSGVLGRSSSLRRVARNEAKQSPSKRHCEHSEAILKRDCFASARNDAVNCSKTLREKILVIASSHLGVREATGNNDGTSVEAYLAATHLPKGNPWCAAFVSWVFKQAGYEKPRTAWSPALFPVARRTLTPLPADVLGIYSLKLKRIAHCGLVERRQNNWIISIEGNTNVNGSRDGDGVYRKWRHIRTIAKFADWVR